MRPPSGSEPVREPEEVLLIDPTPHNGCVRFATVVAFRPATLATKQALPFTWVGLPPAGSRQLLLAHGRNSSYFIWRTTRE
jgi:hypothetical protein